MGAQIQCFKSFAKGLAEGFEKSFENDGGTPRAERVMHGARCGNRTRTA